MKKEFFPIILASSIMFTLCGCSTMAKWKRNLFRSNSGDEVVNEDTEITQTYERLSWWPWGDLDTETPKQKKSRKKIERNQKEMFKKAKKGDAGMQILAGTFFARSEDADAANIQEAAKWFYMAVKNEKATPIQRVSACFHYAMCLEITEAKKKDPKVSDRVRQEIITNYKTAADITLPKGTDQAARGFQQYACYNLAAYYEMDNQEQNTYLYLKKAADLDHPDAAYKVAKMCLNEKSELYNPKLAVSYLEKIAAREHQRAQILLADCYESGLGVDLDYTQMIRWLSLAAKGEQGAAEAQTKLGKCYALGKGVVPDYSLAVKWYERAAEKGYGLAMYELANCYFGGVGVPNDYYKAIHWYKQATQHQQPAGFYGLGVCAEQGLGMKQDLKLAFDYFTKALEGDPSLFIVYFKLAGFYRFGLKVPKNMPKAVEYYQKAGERGFVEAWLELALLFASGTEGVKQNKKNASYCLKEAEEILKYYPRADIAAQIVLLKKKFHLED